jgi:hypothetical protein
MVDRVWLWADDDVAAAWSASSCKAQASAWSSAFVAGAGILESTDIGAGSNPALPLCRAVGPIPMKGGVPNPFGPRVGAMTKVFVSHASADKEFVDEFVDNVLRIGLGLNGDNLFYSSERDTGIPSGADLMHSLRREVGESTLVIAVITPMYQTRPVCVVELGAAWGRATPKHFFPLLSPGLDRAELEGVIPSALTLRIDDSATLDELSDRIEEALGPQASKTQWGVGKQKWLTAVKRVGPLLSRPDIPTVEEHNALRKEVGELREALAYTSTEVEQWKQRFDQLSEVKDSVEVRRIRVGSKPRDNFKNALSAAAEALGGFSEPVRECIYQSLRGSSVAYPNRYSDPDAADAFDDAIERRLIVEEDENRYIPNSEKAKVARAVEGVETLRDAISAEKAGPEFAEWFEAEYDGLEPDLRDRDCWEALLS